MRLANSIVLRTSLLFALLTASVIFAMGVVVRIAVDSHFAEMDRMLLAGKLELIQQALGDMKTPGDMPRIRQELDRALVGHHELLVRIDDAGDRLWYQAGHGSIPADKRTASRWEEHGVPYRGMNAITPAGHRITVGIDISHHEYFLQSFEHELVTIGLCGLTAMAILGFFATRRGLTPLQDMTHLVAHSSAQQLADRLAVDNMPVELRALATAFNEMLDRIGESLTRLSEFSSDLAHELRTPINNLMVQTQVSLSKERIAGEYKEILYTNYEEYERLARMISDMLFLAKADHGLLIPNREPVDVGKEIRALCDFYGVLAEEKGIHLAVQGEAGCHGDALMLRRAFGNLLSNAIRHASPDTCITIAIEKHHDTIQVSISNQGDIIPPEHVPRLFDRFYRADDARTRLDEGVGLGLAITQSIVAAHHGRIDVNSSGHKTAFIVTLPLNTPG